MQGRQSREMECGGDAARPATAHVGEALEITATSNTPPCVPMGSITWTALWALTLLCTIGMVPELARGNLPRYGGRLGWWVVALLMPCGA